MGWGRTRAHSLARAGARAAGTGDAALPGSAAPPVGAQRVHSVPQSTRWPRAARSTLRLMRRRTECAPRWQGSEPEHEAGAHRSNSAKHDPGCGRAVGHAVQGHPHCNPVGRGADARCTRWLAPDACDQSRNFSHNSKMPWHARARIQSNWNQARTAAATSETQGHALPRAPSLLLSPRHIGRAGGRPRPLWVPAVARASRRARSTGLPRICRRRLPRARALQPCNRLGPHRPQQRRPSERVLTCAAACLEHQVPPTSEKALCACPELCGCVCACVRVCVCVCV